MKFSSKSDFPDDVSLSVSHCSYLNRKGQAESAVIANRFGSIVFEAKQGLVSKERAPKREEEEKGTIDSWWNLGIHSSWHGRRRSGFRNVCWYARSDFSIHKCGKLPTTVHRA